jgi:hypothetical protein
MQSDKKGILFLRTLLFYSNFFLKKEKRTKETKSSEISREKQWDK